MLRATQSLHLLLPFLEWDSGPGRTGGLKANQYLVSSGRGSMDKAGINSLFSPFLQLIVLTLHCPPSSLAFSDFAVWQREGCSLRH